MKNPYLNHRHVDDISPNHKRRRTAEPTEEVSLQSNDRSSSSSSSSLNHPRTQPSSSIKINLINEISRNSPIPLSDEQKEVLHHVEPPRYGHKITRVTAAAGTGKTTTILKLAEMAGKLGHSNILYLTFNKATAEEGKERLASVLPYNAFDGRTIDSLVMSLRYRRDNDDEENKRGYKHIADSIEGEVERICQQEIEAFLRRHWSARLNLSEASKEVKKENAKKKVIWLLCKTLDHFCNSTMLLQQFSNRGSSGRNYFPAVLFHRKGGNGNELGFHVFENDYRNDDISDWYADTVAHVLWPTMENEGIKRFNIEMKRAYLSMLEIRASIILVDEAQDCNACQIDWLAKQAVVYGKQVFFVGDPAQSIYSFRGAKSRYLMTLEGAKNCKLTRSWRFGPCIGRIANLCLFAKEHSPQTNTGSANGGGHQTRGTWDPYRIVGSSEEEGVVTSHPMIQSCLERKEQVTVIARKNATLFMKAIELLSPALLQRDSSQGEDDKKSVASSDVATAPVKSDTAKSESTKRETTSPVIIPNIKIHFVGQGGNIKYNRQLDAIMSRIEELQDLYMSSTPLQLSKKLFPEFHRMIVNWDGYKKHIQDFDLGKYEFPTGVVSKFREKSKSAVACFRKYVMEQNHSAQDADLIMCTCHKAKGLEWDNVQVCNDFLASSLPVKEKADGPLVDSSSGKRESWQFDIQEDGDELNLVYVACTRAKKLLSIPYDLKVFIRDCDGLKTDLQMLDTIKPKVEPVDTEKTVDKDPAMTTKKAPPEQKFFVFGIKDLNAAGARDVFADIVQPIRNENEMKDDELLMNFLLTGDLHEEDEDIAKEETAEVKKECNQQSENLQQQQQQQIVICIDDDSEIFSLGEETKECDVEYV